MSVLRHTIKLLIPAGKATPTPPVGPALGQKGVKAIDFCKLFNAQTAKYTPGIPISTKIHVNVNDKAAFTFTTASPPTSWLLKQALGVETLSPRPNDVIVGTLSKKHIYHIAEIKALDDNMQGSSLESVCSRVLAQAVAVGIKVVD